MVQRLRSGRLGDWKPHVLNGNAGRESWETAWESEKEILAEPWIMLSNHHG